MYLSQFLFPEISYSDVQLHSKIRKENPPYHKTILLIVASSIQQTIRKERECSQRTESLRRLEMKTGVRSLRRRDCRIRLRQVQCIEHQILTTLLCIGMNLAVNPYVGYRCAPSTWRV